MKLVFIILLIVTLVLCAAAVICHLVAFSTDHWLSSSNSKESNFLHIGLWVGCFDEYTHPHEAPKKTYDGCHSLRSDYYRNIQDWLVPQWLVTCEILAIIALILVAITIVLIVLLLLYLLLEFLCCPGQENCCERFLVYATPIFMILSGMFEMMVAMVFADNAFKLQCKDFWVGGAPPNDNHLGFSWGFEVAACILSFISGILLILLVVFKRKEYAYKVVG